MKAEYLYKKESDIPLYRGKLVVILTNDIKKLQRYLPDFDADYIYAHAWPRNWGGQEGFIVILNFHSKYRKMKHGTIAHEALHVANAIADERGIPTSYANDEPLAYLTEWVVDQIYYLMDKHKLRAL